MFPRSIINKPMKDVYRTLLYFDLLKCSSRISEYKTPAPPIIKAKHQIVSLGVNISDSSRLKYSKKPKIIDMVATTMLNVLGL